MFDIKENAYGSNDKIRINNKMKEAKRRSSDKQKRRCHSLKCLMSNNGNKIEFNWIIVTVLWLSFYFCSCIGNYVRHITSIKIPHSNTAQYGVLFFFSATIAMTAAAWRLRARARTSEQANVLYCCIIKINENSEGKLASRLNVCKCEPCANIAAYQISDNWCVNNRRRTK